MLRWTLVCCNSTRNNTKTTHWNVRHITVKHTVLLWGMALTQFFAAVRNYKPHTSLQEKAPSWRSSTDLQHMRLTWWTLITLRTAAIKRPHSPNDIDWCQWNARWWTQCTCVIRWGGEGQSRLARDEVLSVWEELEFVLQWWSCSSAIDIHACWNLLLSTGLLLLGHWENVVHMTCKYNDGWRIAKYYCNLCSTINRSGSDSLVNHALS